MTNINDKSKNSILKKVVDNNWEKSDMKKMICMSALLLCLLSGCIDSDGQGLKVCEMFDLLDRKYEVFLEYEDFKIIKRTEIKTYPKELIQENESLFEEKLKIENDTWKLHGISHKWEYNENEDLIETLIIDYLEVNEIWLKTNGYDIVIDKVIQEFRKDGWNCYDYQEYDMDRI